MKAIIVGAILICGALPQTGLGAERENDFETWRIWAVPANCVGKAVKIPSSQQLPQGSVEFQGIADGNYSLTAIGNTPVTDFSKDLEVTLTLTGKGSNPETVVQYEVKGFDAKSQWLSFSPAVKTGSLFGSQSSASYSLTVTTEQLTNGKPDSLVFIVSMMFLKTGTVSISNLQIKAVTKSTEKSVLKKLSEMSLEELKISPDTGRAIAAVAATRENTPAIGGLVFNEDLSGFLGYYPEEEMNIAGIKKLVDTYMQKGHQIKEFLVCQNGQRVLTDSKALDPLWKDIEVSAGRKFYFRGRELNAQSAKYILEAYTLYKKGLDPYKILMVQLREHNVSPWISVRMNDVHNADDNENFAHSDLYREEPELRQEPYRPESWSGQEFDYIYPKVQERHLAYIKECLEKYDMDGLELDFMRFTRVFGPGNEDLGRPILNNLMRQVRLLTKEAEKRWGHPVKIAVRVPSRPDDAYRMGYDVFTWNKEGLFDMLVPSSFFFSTENDMPIELWRQLLSNKIILAPALEMSIRSYHGAPAMRNDLLETAAAQAASYLYRGADRIYLFNFTNLGAKNNELLFSKLGTLEGATSVPRRHIITYNDTPAPGLKNNNVLPLTIRAKAWNEMRVNIGPAPKQFDGTVILAVEKAKNGLELWVNGKRCEVEPLPKIKVPDFKMEYLAWKVPRTQLRNGDNIIEVKNLTDKPNTIHWCEIYIH